MNLGYLTNFLFCDQSILISIASIVIYSINILFYIINDILYNVFDIIHNNFNITEVVFFCDSKRDAYLANVPKEIIDMLIEKGLLNEDFSLGEKMQSLYQNEILHAPLNYQPDKVVYDPYEDQYKAFRIFFSLQDDSRNIISTDIIFLIDGIIIKKNNFDIQSTFLQNYFVNFVRKDELLFVNFKLNTWVPFVKHIFLKLESLVISINKIFNEYFIIINLWVDFYKNYKNLGNKLIILNTQDLFNNSNSELFIDILSKNMKLTEKLLYKKFLDTNTFINSKDKLFKVLALNKKYTRVNIYSYGLFYDLNITTNNKGILNNNNNTIKNNNNLPYVLNHINFFGKNMENVFIKRNVKLIKYFNVSLKNNFIFLRFRNITNYSNYFLNNNLPLLNIAKGNVYSKMQKYLIKLYVDLYVNKNIWDIFVFDEKNTKYHYFLNNKHYQLYKRESNFEFLLPYKGNVHFGYEDNISHYINFFWKKNLLYSDTYLKKVHIFSIQNTLESHLREWALFGTKFTFNVIHAYLVDGFAHKNKRAFMEINAPVTLGLYDFFIPRNMGITFFGVPWSNNTVHDSLNIFRYTNWPILGDLISYFFKNENSYITKFVKLGENYMDNEKLSSKKLKEILFKEKNLAKYNKYWLIKSKVKVGNIKTWNLYSLTWDFINFKLKITDYLTRMSEINRWKYFYLYFDSNRSLDLNQSKLREFGGYTQWWAWHQDSGVTKLSKKLSFLSKFNQNFTTFFNNIKEILLSYNLKKIWYPHRYNIDDLGTLYPKNYNEGGFIKEQGFYIGKRYINIGGIRGHKLAKSYDKIVRNLDQAYLPQQKELNIKNHLLPDEFVINNSENLYKGEVMVSESMEEILNDDYSTLRQETNEERGARYNHQIELAADKLYKASQEVKKEVEPEIDRWIIKPRKIYAGKYLETISIYEKKGIEGPRIKIITKDRAHPVSDRKVIWNSKVNFRWRTLRKLLCEGRTLPWLVKSYKYKWVINKQHGEVYQFLNKKSWQMFLTGDDVFLLDDTVPILSKKIKDQDDQISIGYLRTQVYADKIQAHRNELLDILLKKLKKSKKFKSSLEQYRAKLGHFAITEWKPNKRPPKWMGKGDKILWYSNYVKEKYEELLKYYKLSYDNLRYSLNVYKRYYLIPLNVGIKKIKLIINQINEIEKHSLNFDDKGDFLKFDITYRNIKKKSDYSKDYLREYHISYMKGKFNWPKKIEWVKIPHMTKFSKNSTEWKVNAGPYFRLNIWLNNLVYDNVKRKDIMSSENRLIEMAKFGIRWGDYAKQMDLVYMKQQKIKKIEFGGELQTLFKNRFKTDYILNIATPVVEDLQEYKKYEKIHMSKIKKFNIYNQFIKSMKQSLNLSENAKKWGEKNIMSFFLPQYIQDNFINTYNKSIINYIRKDIKEQWSSIYTNIEDLKGSSELNIIYRNFYSDYIDKKKTNGEIFARNVLVDNIKLPQKNHILLKKSYIINLVNFFQKEENFIKNYILYNIRKEQFNFIKKIINIYKNNLIYFVKYVYYFFINQWPIALNWIKIFILEQLVKVKEIRILINIYNSYEDLIIKILKYIIIITFFIVYCGISSMLVLLLKNFIPKNIIYGIRVKEKLASNEALDKSNIVINNDNDEKIMEQLVQLEDLMEIEIDEKEREKILEEICESLDDIDKKKIKMFFLKKALQKKKLKLKRNFFDVEHKYIYIWEKREDTLFMNKYNLEKNLKKIRVYNKFEDKKNKDLKQNYIALYKTLVFEKNLEKLKDNTKVRYDFWYKKRIHRLWTIIIKGTWFSFKDKKYNISKLLFWNDDELFNKLNDKIIYIYTIPKPFEDVMVIINFIIESARNVLNLQYWLDKWTLYSVYNIHYNFNFKELMTELENKMSPSIEWDIEKFHEVPLLFYYKNLTNIIKKYEKIKKLPLNKNLGNDNKIEKREYLLSNIIKLSIEETNIIKLFKNVKKISNLKIDEEQKYFEELKLLKISEIEKYMGKAKINRIKTNFENKFDNIKAKLELEKTDILEWINIKKLKEQEVRNKYVDKAYINKLEYEKNELERLEKEYPEIIEIVKNVENIENIEDLENKENIGNIEKQLQYRIDKMQSKLRVLEALNDAKEEQTNLESEKEKIKKRLDNVVKMKNMKEQLEYLKIKIDTIGYEKSLIKHNIYNKFFDEGLDQEDKKFYELIPEYNRELEEEYLKINDQNKQKNILEKEYEEKSKNWYKTYWQRRPYNRWWPTIGMRLNYLLVQIIDIFKGWRKNLKLIRKNEYTSRSLLLIILNDIYVFIYKMYWEYLIIWKKEKTFKKLGSNIISILIFSLILTPIIIYSSILYLILWILMLVSTIYHKKRIKQKKIKTINRYTNGNLIYFIKLKYKKLEKSLKYLSNILSFLFKDLETGENILKGLYYNLYRFCGWIQYNIYYYRFFIKGAFDLGYQKYKKIEDAIIDEIILSFLNWLDGIFPVLKIKDVILLVLKIKEGWDSVKMLWELKFDYLLGEDYYNYLQREKRKKYLASIDLTIPSNLQSNRLIKTRVLEYLLDSDMEMQKDINRITSKRRHIIFLIKKWVFRTDKKIFPFIYRNFELYKNYYLNIKKEFNKEAGIIFKDLTVKEWIMIFYTNDKLGWRNFESIKNLKELINFIWNRLKIYFNYVAFYQKRKYVNNYCQGIEGFRINPMYKIIDKPKKKNDWREKLHELIINKTLSNYIWRKLYDEYNIIDIFFVFKIDEAKWAGKNYYQTHFWKTCYWLYKRLKEKVIRWLTAVMQDIEENYGSFEDSFEAKNWTLKEKWKYASTMISFYKLAFSWDEKKRLSRDLLFYKKGKEKNKLERIYFTKGIINWIVYIIIKKVIFSKTKNLKKQTIKHNKRYLIDYKHRHLIKHNLKKINQTIYITDYINEVPSQFWGLFIIYNKYYKEYLRYIYKDDIYPIKWLPNSDWEYKKDYKWRIAPSQHNYEINVQDKQDLSTYLNAFDFNDLAASLDNLPYDPMIRWLIFVLEYTMTNEDLVQEGDIMWDEWKEDTAVWGDISLTHLLTYNKKLDEYKYEIKEFNRLMVNIKKLYVKQDSHDTDKEKFYWDKFSTLSDRLLEKNDVILKKLLKERQLKRSNMLHKALVRNKLQTLEELEQERTEEYEREYYYERKREIFSVNLLSRFLEWQAEYDAKNAENKYFHSGDIYMATYDAQFAEKNNLSKGKLFNGKLIEGQLVSANLFDYAYLLDNIVLKSYDQTVEEVHYFFVFKVWKMLEKELKEKKKRTYINYKHLNLDSTILSRINYDEYLTEVTKTLPVINEEGKETSAYTVHKHLEYFYQGSKLEWEYEKVQPETAYPDNNIFMTYYEVGSGYKHEEPIKYNSQADKYYKIEKLFHGHEVLLELIEIMKKRARNVKNTQKIIVLMKEKKCIVDKKYGEELNVEDSLGYINNVKWTWQQWLFYTDIEKEYERLDRNIVILNERFNLWNLKRMPIRLKLPVGLNVDTNFFEMYFHNKDNYASFLDHKHFLMTNTIGQYLKTSINWERTKLILEKRFNKKASTLILTVLSAGALNREAAQIKKEFGYIFKNFARNYNAFQKLFFVGMASYTWDLIRYHEIFEQREDFSYDAYFQLKQIEFLNHDPALAKCAAKIMSLYIDKYSPIDYVFLFKTHFFFENNFSRIYGLLGISSFFWILKVLLYNQGEYLSEMYMLFAPLLIIFFFWYLRKRAKVIIDNLNAVELYLYRYHSSKALSHPERRAKINKYNAFAKAWVYHFYGYEEASRHYSGYYIDDDEDPEEAYISNDFLFMKESPDWWRHHTHKNKYNKIDSYHHLELWVLILALYYLLQYWKVYQFEYRNSPWLWSYYHLTPDVIKVFESLNKDVPKSYQLREWHDDSYTRLENGGNIPSRSMENFYRLKKGLAEKPLEYGKPWQIIEVRPLQTIYSPYTSRDVTFKGGLGDDDWLFFSRVLNQYQVQNLNNYKHYDKGQYIAHQPHALDHLFKKAQEALDSHLSVDNSFVRSKIEYRTPKRFKSMFSRIESKKHLFASYRDLEKFDFFKQEYWWGHRLLWFEGVNDLRPKRELKIDTEIELKIEWQKLKIKLGELYWGKDFINPHNPKKKLFYFVRFIRDKWNYDAQDSDRLFSKFLLKMQYYSDNLIDKEIHKIEKYNGKSTSVLDKDSYCLKLLKYIEYELNNYKNQVLWRKKYLVSKRLHYLITNDKDIDMRTLLSITENQKHYYNFNYNMLKYKINRLEIIFKKLDKKNFKKILNCDMEIKKILLWVDSYRNWYKRFNPSQNSNFISRWWYGAKTHKVHKAEELINKLRKAEYIFANKIEKAKNISLKTKLEMQNYNKDLKKFKILFEKYENFLYKINKKVSISDIIEYKCDLIMKYLKIKKDFWIFAFDFIDQLGIIQLITIIIKMLFKLF